MSQKYIWPLDVLASLAKSGSPECRFRYHAYVFHGLKFNPVHPDESFVQKIVGLNYVELGDESKIFQDFQDHLRHLTFLVSKILAKSYSELADLGKAGHHFAGLEAIAVADKLTELYTEVVGYRVNIFDVVEGLKWFTITAAAGIEGAVERGRIYRERLKTRTDLDESRFSGLVGPISDDAKRIYGSFFEKCESPPERILLHSLINVAKLQPIDSMLSGDVHVKLQVEINPHRVDFLINGELVVEVDGREYHDNAKAFESDRYRDQDLIMAGYRVLRFPAKQIYLDGDSVAHKIILASKRATKP